MIQNVLVPKKTKEIIDDIYLNHGNGKNFVNSIISLMGRFHENRQVLLALISSPEFDPMMGNGKIFIQACIHDLHLLVKAMLKNGIDPTFNNNRAIRLAYHHQSINTLITLLLDERIKASLEPNTYKELKRQYLGQNI